MAMDTKDMELFLKTADYKSLTKVAEEYGMTQPAVSAVIKRLEESVGSPLFVRRENRLFLNKTGKHFYQIASNVCVNLNHARQSLQLGYSKRAELIISMSIQSDWLTQQLDSFANSHKDISITLRSGADLTADLRLEPADFMVMFQREIRGEQFIPIDVQNSLYAIVPIGHPLASHVSLRMKDLREEPFVFIRHTSVTGYESSYMECIDAGFQPRIALVTDTKTAKYAGIRKGCGIGLVYNNVRATAELIRDCVLIPVQTANTRRRTICLAWNESSLSQAGREFLGFLQDQGMIASH